MTVFGIKGTHLSQAGSACVCAGAVDRIAFLPVLPA